jgi:G6PDH family F420-dependent oxidoreductase
VWSVIGALSEAVDLPVTTATAAVQLDGRFVLGVGSGEALNEHILGDPWPSADVRLEMLEESIEVIRKLHEGGVVNHRGRHYTVEGARVYTLPERPVPIYLSAFGPKAVELSGRVAGTSRRRAGSRSATPTRPRRGAPPRTGSGRTRGCRVSCRRCWPCPGISSR